MNKIFLLLLLATIAFTLQFFDVDHRSRDLIALALLLIAIFALVVVSIKFGRIDTRKTALLGVSIILLSSVVVLNYIGMISVPSLAIWIAFAIASVYAIGSYDDQ